MKKTKLLIALTLVLALLLSMTSCYVISGQRMYRLKGTYKLTRYTYTPKYERKDGVTPLSYDYVNDAEYKYEDYLVITGTGSGYYVHKDAGGEAYVKEITLSYEYSEDKPSKVEYVIFNDSLTVNADEGGYNRLGVAKNNLNYSKAAFDYTTIIGKTPMRSESLSIRWEKVDKATDLSYVNEQIDGLKYYKYDAFAKRGIYELCDMRDTESGEYLDIPYKYFYVVIDTADGVSGAKVCYATKDDPSNKTVKTVTVSFADSYGSVTVDGVTWVLDTQLANSYKSQKDGIESRIRRVSSDISDPELAYLIDQRTA